jgi:hypothetical protein
MQETKLRGFRSDGRVVVVEMNGGNAVDEKTLESAPDLGLEPMSLSKGNKTAPEVTLKGCSAGGKREAGNMSSENKSNNVGGAKARKRKAADAESVASAAAKQELEELREWRRKYEEKDRHLNALFSASSSCIVCLDTKPDLISYGACNHMVCVPCALDHVSKKLMVLRRRCQNTGCKARLSTFGLNVEDNEFSCPLCRQGQLDLMGASLSLLPDFAYHQLTIFCSQQQQQQQLHPSHTTNAATKLNASKVMMTAAAAAAETGAGAVAAAAALNQNLSGLSVARREKVVAEMERHRLAGIKALAEMKKPASAPTKPSPITIKCIYCGLTAKSLVPNSSSSSSSSSSSMEVQSPSEVLRHMWRCPKRTFVCGFRDCMETFSWESVFKDKAPSTVSSDLRNEDLWLATINAAFSNHMQTTCKHLVTCCIGWCDSHKHPAKIPLSQFHNHEMRHKNIHDRFQPIATIADGTRRIEQSLMALLRTEFNNNNNNNNNITSTSTTNIINTNMNTNLTNSNGNITNDNSQISRDKTDGKKMMDNKKEKDEKVDVMTFAGPIAREIHVSLGALNDILRSYTSTSAFVGLRSDYAMVKCPLHSNTTTLSEHPEVRAGLPRHTRASTAANANANAALSRTTFQDIERNLASIEQNLATEISSTSSSSPTSSEESDIDEEEDTDSIAQTQLGENDEDPDYIPNIPPDEGSEQE